MLLEYLYQQFELGRRKSSTIYRFSAKKSCNIGRSVCVCGVTKLKGFKVTWYPRRADIDNKRSMKNNDSKEKSRLFQAEQYLSR